MALAAVVSVAQETPPSTEPKADGQEQEEEKVVPQKRNEITVGYSNFRGNPDISYYARPTEGLALYYLRLFNTGSETVPYTHLSVRGFPKQDNVIEGAIALNRGNTVVRGGRKQHSFFNQDWRPRDPSENNETGISLDHSFAPNLGGFVLYRQDERDARFAAPRDPEHTRSRLVAGGIGGKVGGGNLGLTVSDKRITDDTGVQPDSLQRQFGASYTRDFGDTLSLEGTAGYTRIEQAGLSNSGIRTYTLGGTWDLGPSTGLQFQFGQQHVDLGNVQNAHVRKRLVSSARLLQRWRGWSLQLGYRHNETERVRADQSFVDVPKVNVYDARLAGRVGRARVTLRGSWEDLREAAVMLTSDNRQLQWDDRAMFQAKIDGGGDLFTAYGVYTYKFQQNKDRGVDIAWHNLAVGGSYVFSPVLTGYAEFSADDFRVGGEAESGQALDFYFPNSRSVAAGLNWSKDPGLSASANVNFYESGDVRGTQLTLSVRRRISPEHDLELIVAPWRHEDRLYDLTGYRTTFLMAKYTVRF